MTEYPSSSEDMSSEEPSESALLTEQSHDQAEAVTHQGKPKDETKKAKASSKSPKKQAIVPPQKVTVSQVNLLELNEILKDRGNKKTDLSAIVDEALEQVPASWWEQKKEELTPLDWKIEKIKSNPELRNQLDKQVMDLLAKLEGTSIRH